MKALANEGEHEVAMAVLSRIDIKGKGRQANVLYNMAVKACEKAGDWRAGLQLLRTMQESPELRPDLFTFNTVMATCEKAGQIQPVSPPRVVLEGCLGSLY